MICNVPPFPYKQEQLVQGAPTRRTQSHFWSPCPTAGHEQCVPNHAPASGQPAQVQTRGELQLPTLSTFCSLSVCICVYNRKNVILSTIVP